ncbi:hypothetical protein RFI_27733 [Reticulomyxa filosa]|uniref:Enoyl reductase (ER) domain-containing protein n=1 Tax=Reticulomyxa filosa TaxID=46433 RepID=X6M6U8_RETFI|nr:hypothetical protein RFI_27733 [Reticulomyxa filosa]|eukprot:ETO09644.1 hypothetical protein RFI_27733 [Reticulomyxa filosa]
MKAIVCTKTGKTLEEGLENLVLTTRPIPEPNDSQIQVQVKAAALNYLDGLVLQSKFFFLTLGEKKKDKYQIKFKPPFVPGKEQRHIKKIEVKGFKVGDHICGSPAFPHGAFSEYAICNPTGIWKTSNEMDWLDASGFAITYGTAYMTIVQRAKFDELLKAHRSKKQSKGANASSNSASINALVSAAAGGVGTASIQILKALSEKEKEPVNIIACCGGSEKSDVVQQCGATHIIDYKRVPNWSSEVLQISKNQGLDLFVDVVGGKVFDEALKCMNWYGKMMIIGFAGGEIPKIAANRILLKSIDVSGVLWGATGLKDFPSFYSSLVGALRLYDEGLLKPVVGNTFSFTINDVRQAFVELFSRKSVGKLVVCIDNTCLPKNLAGSAKSKL